MSANYLIDLGGTCQTALTLPPSIGIIGSGGCVDSRLSGILIGAAIDMINSDSFCNVFAMGVGNGICSGPLVLQVQTSDSNTSGNFTDPTSGLPNFPSPFQSGGLLYIGQSGNSAPGTFNSGFNSGQQYNPALLSGWACAAAFVRNGRFARVNMLSGFYEGSLQVALVSQFKTTGSGGGQSQQPGSGTVNV